MKNFVSIYTISALLLLSCNLITDNTVSGTAENTFTAEPVEGLPISFHAVSSGFLFGGKIERNKYVVNSGVGGKFSFEAAEEDLHDKFSPELHDIRLAKINEYDSLAPLWNYLIVSKTGIYRDSDKNTIVKLKPSGLVNLRHPWLDDHSYTTDTIIVRAYHQKVILTIENGFGQLFFPERTIQDYSVEYILDNNERKVYKNSVHVPTVLKPIRTDEVTKIISESVSLEIPKW